MDLFLLLYAAWILPVLCLPVLYTGFAHNHSHEEDYRSADRQRRKLWRGKWQLIQMVRTVKRGNRHNELTLKLPTYPN